MLILAFMLGIALIPSGSGYWFDIMQSNENQNGDYVPGLPVVCFFRVLGSRMYSGAFDQGFEMAVSLVMLIIGYLSRCIRIFDEKDRFSIKTLLQVPARNLKKSIDRPISRPHHSRISTIVRRVSLGIYVLAKAITDLLGSMLWEVRIFLLL